SKGGLGMFKRKNSPPYKTQNNFLTSWNQKKFLNWKTILRPQNDCTTPQNKQFPLHESNQRHSLFRFERGAALISVLALSALIVATLPLIFSNIQLEYAETSHELNQLRARYNARSAAELSLLRTLIYKEAQKTLQKSHSKLPEQVKKIMGSMIPSLLDMIWRSPVVWPLPMTDNLLENEKREVQKLTKESLIRGSYLARIQPEDGKIDINDLSSSVELLRRFTYETLINLLLLQEEDERNYTKQEVLQVLNELTDWIDPDQKSQSGGIEKTPGGRPFPNRSFVSMEEVQRAPGMKASLYKALHPYTTVYGSKGLNINYIQAPLLQALGFPPELKEEILARINPSSQFYQRFKDVKEFCEWLQERGFDFCRSMEDQFHTQDLLQFNTPLHFRIQAIGQFKASQARIKILTYDANQATAKYQTALEAEKNYLNPPPQDENKDPSKPEQKASPPPLPYSTSSPLLIMYWKEEL
ncbi:MAG: type II secretion system protein GspK, partial [Bdellovibrionales bacterium]|nr:type II secretion system protein GspK [Bdellovibrionales bacterium]